jgi:mono/diheme cytochrome c family protein
MKNVIRISAMFLIISAISMVACKNNPKPVTPAVAEPTGEQMIQKGEYLVRIMGCNDCHSPKELGPQGPVVRADLLLSGYPSDRPLKKVNKEILKSGWAIMNEDFTATAGMWGISFGANLTSDQTGIGNWTEENFKRALKEGKYKGLADGRTLLPPMPWTNFTTISDEDVKAIFAYLKNTKPIKNVVPLPVPFGDIK